MAETLQRNADGDDYIRIGAYLAESWANDPTDPDVSNVRNVNPGLTRETYVSRAQAVSPDTGRIIMRREIPRFN